MSLFNELKRRNVFKVVAAYVIIGWLVMQIGEVMSPALLLPDWINSALAFFVILGFPFAIFFAWAFEMTPEGLKKERDVDRSQSITHATGRKLDFTIIGLLVLALGYFAWDKFVLDPKRDAELISTAQLPSEDVSAKTSSAEPPDRKSIAVLPFQNRSANEENTEFFSDGVHDEILTNLSKIGSLKVISRTSVMTYRDTTKSMPQIGEELGVATLLEGGVQRAGDNVRINVQLIDAASDEHIWADTYDRQLTAESVFAIQTEIAGAIADALHAALSPEEQAELSAIPTTSLEAWDLFLLARQLFYRQNWDSLEHALVELETAIELDPAFQAAHVLRAETYASLVGTGARIESEVVAPWQSSIDRALELDPESGSAHAARARYLGDTDQPGAAEAFSRALQIEPHNVSILQNHASFLRANMKPDQALQELLAARDLDPISTGVWFGLGRTYMMLGDPDQASEAYARIRAIDPSSANGKAPAAGPFISSGQIAQSLYWIFQGLEADPMDLDLTNWVVRHYIDFEDLSTARRWLDSKRDASDQFPFSIAHEAMLEVYAGRVDEAAKRARQHLERGMMNRWGSESMAARVLLIEALAADNPGPALELIETAHPALFLPSRKVSSANILQAVDTAHLLQEDGQDESATALLNAVLTTAERPYELAGGRHAWKVTAKSQALALLGDKQAAIEELRKRVEDGWRILWRWETEMNPNFASLQDEMEFRKIVTFLREDMARQSEEARAMEAAGEIPSPPGAGP